MQFIAFIIKNAHQASLAEIVNFCNAFPCAGFLIIAYPMTMAESKMCENIGLTAYIYKGDPNHYRTREILTSTPGPKLFFEETMSLINNGGEEQKKNENGSEENLLTLTLNRANLIVQILIHLQLL